MTAIIPTRLENWLRNRLAPQPLSLDTLAAFQLAELNQTLAHVRENSPFYRERFKNLPNRPLTDLAQLADFPMMTADDLRRYHLDMLCVSHGQVSRVVTMQTSGTTAAPKRLYFSEADLERNIDFFHHGLTCMTDPGQTLLIMLPGHSPDSAADQLQRAAARVPLEAHIHWPVLDLERLIEEIEEKRIDCLAGAPSQIFALCRHAEDAGRLPPNSIKSVLLTTDYVPRAAADGIRRSWGCRVFEHYGMSEMGLGGAMACDAHQGYHLREADLLVEVVDPDDGTPLPPGVEGEVVFTTLARQAMPLIRYRTGDRAAWLEGPCACGSILRRLGRVRGRIADLASERTRLSMPQLDEAILSLPGVYSFQAVLEKTGENTVLSLNLYCREQHSATLKDGVHAAVARLLESGTGGGPAIRIHTHPPDALRWDSTGMIKRTIG
ncbi:hypothetical protein DSCO28_63030 [Desulfosarcina ovata subsp. sediminis]|uniref:AMP-dependent synthetase/ligase domain-containing protein n=1 Tax=Desulfosarcina ovata subsp. sediminis TaxID=885957 RepID=A0A5K7ZZP6_9BACT|nr:AMP-binding protein [Desulfosarcina ovata]BBO85737.1 hypothetical protein DSCO28_63030 [Desulfosarcina ovata subsp. sediminis]